MTEVSKFWAEVNFLKSFLEIGLADLQNIANWSLTVPWSLGCLLPSQVSENYLAEKSWGSCRKFHFFLQTWLSTVSNSGTFTFWLWLKCQNIDSKSIFFVIISRNRLGNFARHWKMIIDRNLKFRLLLFTGSRKFVRLRHRGSRATCFIILYTNVACKQFFCCK